MVGKMKTVRRGNRAGRALVTVVAALVAAGCAAARIGDASVVLESDGAVATVALHGATVTSWIPRGGREVLFMPRTYADQERGTQVHGGVPLCWPWFVREGPDGARIHGVARYTDWRVKSREGNRLVLTCSDTAETRRAWPYRFRAEVGIALGADTLDVSFTAVNTDDKPFTVTEAFHPYFSVSHVTNCVVTGTDGLKYLDARRRDLGDQRIFAGTCRVEDGAKVFEELAGRNRTHELIDRGWGRTIRIDYSGVIKMCVWNSGPDFPDFAGLPEDVWTRFVCVEGCTTYRNRAYTLAPGASHTMTLHARLLPQPAK